MGIEGYQTASGGLVTDATLQSGTPENCVIFLIRVTHKF